MLLTFTEIVLPLVLLGIASFPIIRIIFGKLNKNQVKRSLITHVALFFSSIAIVLLFSLVFIPSFLAEEVAEDVANTAFQGSLAQGLGFISAALVTGCSCLGAGFAVASAAPAAIGAFSENPKNFAKSMIFVVLGEGVAIYGLLISILIVNKL
ncbi:MAG: ATP synthase subunit C [Acholeplasmatales bacterium]|jgi:V/A-type H+-transporting ATPase subunit K|nr:ATP synthase subunit C [Acholeplasmatales bacterium]